MRDPVDRAARAIARRNSLGLVWARFGVSHTAAPGESVGARPAPVAD